jgi:membrane-associated phospholipid phosphatase
MNLKKHKLFIRRKLMYRLIIITTLCLLAGAIHPVWGADSPAIKDISSYLDDIKTDYEYHYSLKKLTHLGLTLGAGGILANTSLDRRFRDSYQDDMRSDGVDKFFDAFTFVGDVGHLQFAVPIYLGAMLIGRSQPDSAGYRKVHDWGWRSIRTLLLGAPQQFFFTNALGSGRPEEGDSNWDFFDDSNGVSGHAFYGAVPLITAAAMAKKPVVKYGLYTVSVLPGLARINDDQHYLSQVVIGWMLAYMAADTVNTTDSSRESRFSLLPLVLGDGGGICFTGVL